MKQELRNKDVGTPIERYKKSFFHALDGIIYALKYEHNMIIILLATLVVISLGFMLKINEIEYVEDNYKDNTRDFIGILGITILSVLIFLVGYYKYKEFTLTKM